LREPSRVISPAMPEMPLPRPPGSNDCADGSAATTLVPIDAIVSASGRCHATPYSHSIAVRPQTPVTVLRIPGGAYVARQSCAKSQSVS
jgi:hypothetical protein